MRPYRCMLLGSMMIAFIASTATAQVVDTLDLSKGPDLGSVAVPAGSYVLFIAINANPTFTYTFASRYEAHTIPPLPSVPLADITKASPTPCIAASDSLLRMKGQPESHVPSAVAGARKA